MSKHKERSIIPQAATPKYRVSFGMYISVSNVIVENEDGDTEEIEDKAWRKVIDAIPGYVKSGDTSEFTIERI